VYFVGQYKATDQSGIFDAGAGLPETFLDVALVAYRHVNRELDIEGEYQVASLLRIRGAGHAFARHALRVTWPAE